jgi:hypothetical protein
MFVEAVFTISMHHISSLNSKHFRLSAQAIFSLISLCPCFIEKLTFLNHGKAYALKKANISCSEPVSQFLVL